MSFFINTNNINRISSYADAKNYFDSTKKVRSHRWSEHQRPLRNTRDTHIRLERSHDEQYFDVCLYRTALVRYFKPADNGEYAVWLSNFNSTSTAQFMGAQGWYHHMKLNHDGDDTFMLPISFQTNLANTLWNSEFTVKLVFNDKHQVIRDKSIYIPACGIKSSTNMRAKRKQFRDRIAVIMDMVDMRFGEHERNCMVDVSRGVPFNSSMTHEIKKQEYNIKEKVKLFADGLDISSDMTDIVQYAFVYSQVAYDNIVNQRASKLRPDSEWERGENGEWRRKSLDFTKYVKDNAPLSKQSPEIYAQLLPDQESVRKGVENRLMMLAKLDFGDTPKPYPLFAKDLPRKHYIINAGMTTADLFAGDITDNMLRERGVAG